jgi:hypothetical protein
MQNEMGKAMKGGRNMAMTPECPALQTAYYFIFKAHDGKRGSISNLLQKS